MSNLVYVQFNAKLLNKKRREEEYGADVLVAKEASKAQGWIVDGGDDDEEDDEVYPGSGLTWRMVGDATGADEVLESRKSGRNVGSTSSREVRELHEEDFASEEDTEDEPDGTEEDIVFTDSDGDQLLEEYGAP